MKNYASIKKKILRDKEVWDAYDTLGPQFNVIQMMIRKRIQKGITQKELAREIGTKQSAISRFESGDYNPTISFLYKLAGALGVELTVSVK